jgi:DNA-binding NtrC family response regulator
LRLYAARYRSSVRHLPPELVQAFLRYEWPGNVRELENAIRRHLILPGEDVWPGPQPVAETAAETTAPRRPKPAPDLSLRRVSALAADQAEREMVRQTLAETRWNRREAARRLKISYKALLNKLKKWDAAPDDPSVPGAAEQPKRTGAAH